VSGFSADWLDLRERADTQARSAALVEALPRDRNSDSPLAVFDLGAGTGANLRYLAPKLGGLQHWLLVDDDDALLDVARVRLIEWGRSLDATVTSAHDETLLVARGFTCAIRTRKLDLAQDFVVLALPDECLVTASALIDLVSARWLEQLATACRTARASILLALTYDGRMMLEPGDPDDDFAVRCFNRHQLLDKGFGSALGPRGAEAAEELLAAQGFDVRSAASHWRLDSRHRRLQAQLLDGWLAAAIEIAPEERLRLTQWHAAHRRRIDVGETQFVVGHRDVLARVPIT
jgi:SAM-dependent methyltransferase